MVRGNHAYVHAPIFGKGAVVIDCVGSVGVTGASTDGAVLPESGAAVATVGAAKRSDIPNKATARAFDLLEFPCFFMKSSSLNLK